MAGFFRRFTQTSALMLQRHLKQNPRSPPLPSSRFERFSTSGNISNTQTKANTEETQGQTKSDSKLVISSSCVERLRKICKDGNFLRITVEGGGCSGFQYKFDLDSKMNDDDLEFGEKEAKVVIDTVSLEYCAGATVDYHEELIRSGFRIVANPKAEQGCSCGASFAIKID